jgi:A/G-specific adenine glycosylase
LISPELQQAILDWYAASGRDLPWRQTRDPYAILVSEMMLQQTQVDRVLPKYSSFLAQYPDFAALAAAPTGDVIRAWQGLGYNLRAVRLQRIARQVVREHQGLLPDTVEGLLALDGLGRYTASAVACFAFGRAEPVLDTNVRRVLGRIALGPDGPKSASATSLWRLAEEALPREHAYAWNQALMDLGARICMERNPMCLLCPARPWCQSAGRVASGLRERPASYVTRREAPFAGSSRFYRGRIVERLRGLAPGETLPLAALGQAIRPDFDDAHLPWLRELVTRLEQDGLLVAKPDDTLALPDTQEP